MELRPWSREQFGLFPRRQFGCAEGIQIPESCLKGSRPLGADGQPMHRHGCYYRRKHPTGPETIAIQRYLDPRTGRTASVLPENRVPYRPVEASRLEAHFDQCAGIGSGPDPPPEMIEAGCLRRAWKRLTLRQDPLRRAFGQLIGAYRTSVKELWCEIRQARSTLGAILGFLFERHNLSLLGSYACSVDWRK